MLIARIAVSKNFAGKIRLNGAAFRRSCTCIPVSDVLISERGNYAERQTWNSFNAVVASLLRHNNPFISTPVLIGFQTMSRNIVVPGTDAGRSHWERWFSWQLSIPRWNKRRLYDVETKYANKRLKFDYTFIDCFTFVEERVTGFHICSSRRNGLCSFLGIGSSMGLLKRP